VLKYFRKTPVIALFGISCTILFIFLSLNSPRFVDEHIETVFLDGRFQVRNMIKSPPVPENIAIVEIDEKSLEEYGRWPWSRIIQAQLIDRIISGNPRVLAVDIFYPEVEDEQSDLFLGNTIRKYKGKIVLAAGFDFVTSPEEENVPDYLINNAILEIKDFSKLKPTTVNKQKISIPDISTSSVLGHVYSPPDMDGKLRWEHLYIDYAGDIYPSLSLMTAATALGLGLEDITVYGGRDVELGKEIIPSDISGRMRINYIGPERTIHYISASDVMKKYFDLKSLNDMIIYLGTSAISTYDFSVTPFSARMPGVEKNATVTENILNRRFLRDAPISVAAFIILITGIALSVFLPHLRALSGLLLSSFVIVLFAIFNQLIFTFNDIYVNFTYPFTNLFIISMFAGSYKYVTEELRARELKRMFHSYVSPKIVDQLIANPEMAKLGGQRREVTILFSDIRGFTTFSEKHEPEEVVSKLNEYLKEMTDIVFRWDGTLDKFVGDEIMAFWGAPLDQPDHAERAMRCALHMSARLDELQNEWKARGEDVLDCGIGLNTGAVLIGNIGAAGKKMDYTAIGDHVNLGARVEALTRQYQCRILITEFTHEKIADLLDRGAFGHLSVCKLEEVKVKGKARPVRILSVGTEPENPVCLIKERN